MALYGWVWGIMFCIRSHVYCVYCMYYMYVCVYCMCMVMGNYLYTIVVTIINNYFNQAFGPDVI